MKKLIAPFLSSFIIAACGSKQVNTNDKNPKSSWVAYPLNRVGYITELNNNLEDNYFRKIIEKEQQKYKFKMDGLASPSYDLKFSTTRIYSVDSVEELKNSFKILNQNNVGLTIVQNNKWANQLQEAKIVDEIALPEINIYKEYIDNKIYGGYMALIGKDSRFYLTKEGKIGTRKQKWEWKSDKIATFTFSEIVSAYYMGYITQYTFGLTSDGIKQNVGYILGATYEDQTNRSKNIKKAVAFRQGVLDAVKEKETGEASFVSKTQASSDANQQTLVRKSTDLEEIIPKLAESSKYKDQEHSFTYFAGASSEYNKIIALSLKEHTVKNINGHNIIGEKGSTTIGDLFESSNDTNYFKASIRNDEGEEIHVKNKSVVGRISMFYNEDNKFYRNNEYNEQLANEIAIKILLKSIFEDDDLFLYFNKHTFVGTFPVIYKPGENQVPSDAQEAKLISEDLKNFLIKKFITEEQFKTESDFLGWLEQ